MHTHSHVPLGWVLPFQSQHVQSLKNTPEITEPKTLNIAPATQPIIHLIHMLSPPWVPVSNLEN